MPDVTPSGEERRGTRPEQRDAEAGRTDRRAEQQSEWIERGERTSVVGGGQEAPATAAERRGAFAEMSGDARDETTGGVREARNAREAREAREIRSAREASGAGEGNAMRGGTRTGAGAYEGKDADTGQDAYAGKDAYGGRDAYAGQDPEPYGGGDASGEQGRTGAHALRGTEPGSPTAAGTATEAGTAAPAGRSERTGQAAAPHTASSASSLLPGDQCDKLTARIQHAVAEFVDRPHDAVEEADHVLEELTASFTDAMNRRRRTLRGSWQLADDTRGDRDTTADTEQLRLALRDYRELTERLLHI
ncbi:hypothetical protein [Streptomyces sp. NPDC088812]|uniref:hypothetical protein n=1 Tax=Streptomyces sp. NPDC088812 TaxID=3365905 RepID=UPI003811AED5